MKNRFLLLPSFFASWLTIELAPLLLVWEAVGVAFFVWTGALDEAAGWVALALAAGTAGALVALMVTARRTRVILHDACADLDLVDAPPFPKSQVFFPLIARRRKGVHIVRNLTFAE